MWRRTLIGIALFNVLSCILGWIYLIPAGHPGMAPSDSLRPGNFPDFTIPGWILLIVLGGINLVSLVTLFRRQSSSAFWAGASGFAMVIWIYVEVCLMTGSGILHHIYLAVGLAQLGCTLAFLGIFDSRAKSAIGQKPLDQALKLN